MSCPLIANADVMRITRVDQCGNPVCGEDNGFVFECFSSLAMNVNSDDGDDITYKAANGKVCGTKRGCPTFNGLDLELNVFSVSPEMVEILTGNPVFLGYDGTPIGFDTCSIQCNTGFALELWAEVLGEECADGAEGQWLYWLMPWVTNGIIGDLEIGSEAVTLQITGSTRAGGSWGVGPYDVQPLDAAGTPGPMLTPLSSSCHRRTFLTTVAPPEPSCDYTPVTCDSMSLAS
ncbi:hypothetical protein [Streptomyces canus]|uniref:hypothetical protein n=1 Tax=Streptomyces canus TaxID=58343 RepID=UPI0027863DEB|nr:hypothetical protein [Streptomyces canus]MDQ0761982.1 hypothetical protein [Streptomyces canus]